MSIFKCKMCGGTLEINKEQSVAICEYCGTKQTLPKFDNERRANLYDRANHFRRNNDFDKAMGIYENILNEDNTDAEAYWSIVLCRYGVEYVEDPATHKRIPTVNRAQFTSVFDDEDYKSAIKNADDAQREIYEAEAYAINEIQKGILAISQKEEPFDIFICYKETDANGRRTQDSVLATDLYRELTQEGFKVFFSRITLEDKLGIAYEPYIFAALHSAKIMVVLGTKSEHFNAVWVKNEWGRYLSLIKNGAKKTLIPAYRDMDPYDLPDEFSHLQAQDMSKLGFMQDLIRGIRKILNYEPRITPTVVKETVIATEPVGVEPLLRRASMALADREFERADAFYEQILNHDPENAEAYVGKLMIELHVRSKSELYGVGIVFDKSNNYKKAIQFANDELKKELLDALQTVKARINEKKMEGIYRSASNMLENARDIPTCKRAMKFFLSISDYRDAGECAQMCQEKIDAFYVDWENYRIEQQKKAKKRRRTNIIGYIASLTFIITVIFSILACLFVFKIQIPNSKYEQAMELLQEEKYDEAIVLLKEAHYDALLDKDVKRFENAIYRVQDAKRVRGIVDNVKSTLDSSINKEGAAVDYVSTISNLLSSGVTVKIEYLCDDGRVKANTSAKLEGNVITYDANSTFIGFPAATRTGCNFKSWTYEKSEYSISDGVFYITFKANWSLKVYTIKYRVNEDESNKVIKYNIEKDDFALPIPQKDGYVFIGWTGMNVVDPTVDLVIPKGSYGDKDYVAHWAPIDIKVTFDSAGGNAIAPILYKYGQYVDLLPQPTREHYVFDGWYNGEEKFDFSRGTWNILNDITLVARWTPEEYTITYHSDFFPNDWTNTLNPVRYNVESDTIVLKDMTFEGGTFLGWYTDINYTQKITEIPKGTTGDIEIYARLEFETFTIEYDLNGGTSQSLRETFTAADLPLTLYKPLKSGHSFYYWAEDELDGEPIVTFSELKNYKLVANYIPDGLTLSILSGGDRKGRWCRAKYEGGLKHIEIPKYHMKDSSCDSPYIQTLDLSDARNLLSVSFSDEILEVRASSNLECEIYKNGIYCGSRNNPYHALINKVEGTSLTTIHPDTVIIGSGTFSNNSDVLSLVIPKNLKEINFGAFYSCYKLVEIYNLSSLNISLDSDENHGSILGGVNVVHTSLDALTTISTYGDFIVQYIESTDTYKIIDYIGKNVKLVLPDNINGRNYTVASYAFYNRVNFISVVVPEAVNGIEAYAFDGCNRIFEIYNRSNCEISVGDTSSYQNGGIAAYAKVVHTMADIDEPSMFIEKDDYYFYYNESDSKYYLAAYGGNDVNLVLPDDINGNSYIISVKAFMNDKSIVSVTISEGVDGIMPNAFYNCENLTDVIFKVTSGWAKNIGSDGEPIVYEAAYISDSKEMATFLKSYDSYNKILYRA